MAITEAAAGADCKGGGGGGGGGGGDGTGGGGGGGGGSGAKVLSSQTVSCVQGSSIAVTAPRGGGSVPLQYSCNMAREIFERSVALLLNTLSLSRLKCVEGAADLN